LAVEELITEEVRLSIENAIHAAEQGTAGEIRVHVDSLCPEAVLDRASFVFEKLEMHKTEARNGVLIYVSVDDHKAAIIGDVGINVLVEKDYWNVTLQNMLSTFKNKDIITGLLETVDAVGKKIKVLFPILPNDQNELPNTVTVGHHHFNKKKQ
jgi:uncharacterized membrane protein